MSWFRHRTSKSKTSKLHPHTTSPMTIKSMETLKEQVRKPTKNSQNKKPVKD